MFFIYQKKTVWVNTKLMVLIVKGRKKSKSESQTCKIKKFLEKDLLGNMK